MRYSEAYLNRLKLIRKLQSQHLPLEEIKTIGAVAIPPLVVIASLGDHEPKERLAAIELDSDVSRQGLPSCTAAATFSSPPAWPLMA